MTKGWATSLFDIDSDEVYGSKELNNIAPVCFGQNEYLKLANLHAGGWLSNIGISLYDVGGYYAKNNCH